MADFTPWMVDTKVEGFLVFAIFMFSMCKIVCVNLGRKKIKCHLSSNAFTPACISVLTVEW